jgi:hypothetical protein
MRPSRIGFSMLSAAIERKPAYDHFGDASTSAPYSVRLLISFTAFFLVGAGACASDKITLSCYGILRAQSSPETQMPTETIIIDLDREIVTTGTLGNFSVTKVTKSSIKFENRSEDGQTKSTGGVDRYSDSIILTTWRDNKIASNYTFTCKRAKMNSNGRGPGEETGSPGAEKPGP